MNETSQSREKRDIVKGLRKLCPGRRQRIVRLHHLSVNETSQSREKRDIVEGLKNICPGTYRVSSKAASGCVRTWLYCTLNGENLSEPQCASQSTSCLHSISKFGFPKCAPLFCENEITFPDGQRKRIILNTACVCA